MRAQACHGCEGWHIHKGKSNHRVLTNGQGDVPPIVGAAFAMAKGTASVGSAGGADEAAIAASEALGPRAYGKAGGGMCGVDGLLREGEQAHIELKGMQPCKGHQRVQEEGPVRAWK